VLSKGVVSIVDDDESVCLGTMDLIESMGYVAETYTRAEDFLRSGLLWQMRCVIADVQMPGMTGLELHEYLVRSGNVIPTILITAFPKDADRARALRAGVAGYLIKPFGDRELLACIRAVVREPAGTDRRIETAHCSPHGGFPAWAWTQDRSESER